MPSQKFRIQLTDEEKKLISEINLYPNIDSSDFYDTANSNGMKILNLFTILQKRKAIPAHRMAYFLDAKFNIGTKKSRKEVFESNGCHGNDILKDAHFCKYFAYFIDGPNLPQATIDACEKKLITICSGAIPEYIPTYIVHQILIPFRNIANGWKNDKRHRPEQEFFQLAIELGFTLDQARQIRLAVMKSKQ
jgi:hypothetical protein